MNKYTTVLIEQKKEGDKYTLTILIDGKEFKKVDFSKEPQEYGPSELFASDNFYNPGKAKIKNLKFINLGKFFLLNIFSWISCKILTISSNTKKE